MKSENKIQLKTIVIELKNPHLSLADLRTQLFNDYGIGGANLGLKLKKVTSTPHAHREDTVLAISYPYSV